MEIQGNPCLRADSNEDDFNDVIVVGELDLEDLPASCATQQSGAGSTPSLSRSQQTALARQIDMRVKEGDIEDMKRLIVEAGTDHQEVLNLPLSSYRTPLHTAARYGHLAAASELVRANANVNAKSRLNRTPLHTAASHGHVDIVRLLLEAQADPDAAMSTGATPMSEAIRHGHTDVAAALLQGGAEPNGSFWSRFWWLQWTSAASFTAAVPFFTVQSIACPPLGLAVTAAGVSSLVGAWALGGPGASTPLSLAVKTAGRDEGPGMVRELLTSGADANRRDGRCTPLHLSVLRGNALVAATLLSQGARANVASGWLHPTMPLRAAVDRGELAMVKVLVQGGAQVDARDADGVTALHRAVDMATSGVNSMGEAAVLMAQACPRALTLPVNLSCASHSRHLVVGAGVSGPSFTAGSGVVSDTTMQTLPVTPLQLCLRRGVYWLYDVLSAVLEEEAMLVTGRRSLQHTQRQSPTDQGRPPPRRPHVTLEPEEKHGSDSEAAGCRLGFDGE